MSSCLLYWDIPRSQETRDAYCTSLLMSLFGIFHFNGLYTEEIPLAVLNVDCEVWFHQVSSPQSILTKISFLLRSNLSSCFFSSKKSSDLIWHHILVSGMTNFLSNSPPVIWNPSSWKKCEWDFITTHHLQHSLPESFRIDFSSDLLLCEEPCDHKLLLLGMFRWRRGGSSIVSLAHCCVLTFMMPLQVFTAGSLSLSPQVFPSPLSLCRSKTCSTRQNERNLKLCFIEWWT